MNRRWRENCRRHGCSSVDRRPAAEEEEDRLMQRRRKEGVPSRPLRRTMTHVVVGVAVDGVVVVVIVIVVTGVAATVGIAAGDHLKLSPSSCAIPNTGLCCGCS